MRRPNVKKMRRGIRRWNKKMRYMNIEDKYFK